MIRSAIVLLLLLLHFHNEVVAEIKDRFIGNVPLEIYQLMKKKQCSPIEGFYDRIIISPSFIYVDKLLDGNIIFFVCQIDNSMVDRKYKMVIIREDYSNNKIMFLDFENCPNEIYFEHIPGGLSIIRNPDISSFDYNRWMDTRKNIWRGKNKLNIDIGDNPSWIINERAEGVGYGFFCVDNEWYHVSYD